MAGGTLTLWLGLAGSLALGCVADPVARRDEDPLDAGVADAVMVAPVPDADPVDAAPRTPECVLEADDPRTGETIHRCELFERDRLSVCEQFAQCLCIAGFEYAGEPWQAADLLMCIGELVEVRGAITLADDCLGASVSEVAAKGGVADVDPGMLAPLRPVAPGCGTLATTFDRALPWPEPEDNHCALDLRDVQTGDTRTCAISAAAADGTCEQAAYCLCAPALQVQFYPSNEYYRCLTWAFLGDLGLQDRCKAPGARVADVSGRFDTTGQSAPGWQADVTPSPGCADVPLDPRSGAAPR